MTDVIAPPPTPRINVIGGGAFPVRRIFCVGKNYADHVKEMGGDAKKSSPIFFTKPADAIVLSGNKVSYPSATKNLHFEGELVVALKSGGKDIRSDDAIAHIFGYAAGCDLTRRDLQELAKKGGNPWDIAKAFDQSAPTGDILPAEKFINSQSSNLLLSVNGKTKQEASLATMIWSIAQIIESLSALFELKAGDLIFTGTPKGVGPLVVGDNVKVEIGNLPILEFEISA